MSVSAIMGNRHIIIYAEYPLSTELCTIIRELSQELKYDVNEWGRE